MIGGLCQKTFSGGHPNPGKINQPLAARASSVTQYRAAPSAGLRGDTSVPGDKSISHRALILAALTVGRTKISGILASGDVTRTAKRCWTWAIPVRARDC